MVAMVRMPRRSRHPGAPIAWPARSCADAQAELLTAGTLALAGEAIGQADRLWPQDESAASARWCRDKPILGLGKDARRQRAVLAWARVGVVQAEPG
jgi:hypothetical protein